MPIYHFNAKIVSRERGQSIVAAAAYRAGEALQDERYGIVQNYTRKRGIVHSEILAPEGSPDWVRDRETLWNRVEAGEIRKDAQLGREIEIALPLELSHEQNVALLRDYVSREFVAHGMIADIAIHRDNTNNPHAHVLLTMRRAVDQAFGPKAREWNAKANLLERRASWAERANDHLAKAGFDLRIDHRTLAAQHIDLLPGRKIGIAQERQAERTLPRYVAERVAESKRIAQLNGDTILGEPKIALKAITHQRATFTFQDVAKFLHTRTEGAEQFEAVYLKVTTSDELVPLGRDDQRRMRYTTRDMLQAERSLLQVSIALSKRKAHAVGPQRQAAVLRPSGLAEEQRLAFEHLTAAGDLKAVVGVAGSGKSTLLAAAREAWEAQGFTVKGAALSGIAAENLQLASGIRSRTLASFEYAWKEGRDPLTPKDVLVIDEAGMIGTQQLGRMLAAANKAHAKVVLVGDPEQLQAIEAGAAFRGVVGAVGMTELTQVRRQKHAWAREATQALATARTGEALVAYEAQGAVIATDTKAQARARLLEAWAADANSAPAQSRLILAYTREEVRELNTEARMIRRSQGELGRAEVIETPRGEREFAAHDRVMFLRNEKSLGVKNGSLGTIEAIEDGLLQVKLDGADDRRIVVETRDYQDLEHGYATTVHKSQGATVDRTYVLASRYFDRHTTYVALSRHRESALLFYGREDFVWGVGKGDAAMIQDRAREKWRSTLSRERPQELAHDFLDRDIERSPAAQAADLPRAMTSDEIQAAAQQRWLAYRAGIRAGQETGQGGARPSADRFQDHGQDGPGLDDGGG